MGRKEQRQEATARFEKYLAAYQKIAMLLLIPALLSTFWSFIPFGNPEISAIMVLASARLLNAYAAPSFSYGGALLSLGIMIVILVCTLYAAKGKLPFFVAGIGIYAFDLAIDVYLMAAADLSQGSIFSIVIHSVFVIAFGIGVFLYFQAKKYLLEEERLSK